MAHRALRIDEPESSALTGLRRNKPIKLSQEAVDATPQDHPDWARRHYSLGIEYRDRYERTGTIADLERAIELSQEAVDTTPQDHPDRARRLHTLGVGYGVRYERIGTIADLERAIELSQEAIELSQEAIDATPQDHPDRARRLHTLGIGYRDRDQRTRIMAGLERAKSEAVRRPRAKLRKQIPRHRLQKSLSQTASSSPNTTRNTPCLNDVLLHQWKRLLSAEVMKSDIPLGRVRMNWTCNCGYEGYDDYFETTAGAVQDLCDRMERAGSVRRATTATTARVTVLHVIQALQSYWQTVRVSFSNTHLLRRSFPDQIGAGASGSISNQHRPSTQASDYLLLCVKDGRYATAMHTMQADEMKSDEELFDALRGRFHRRRGSMWRLFALNKIKGIHFVQFAMRKNALVDCIQKNLLPPKTARHYGFSPRPPGTMPPLGSQYLLHRFHNPHDGAGDVLCLKQFPKRLEKRPERGKDPDNDIAWGVHFVEGPHLAKVYTILASVVAFGSLIFGILFWVFKQDLQGAFGVASYITSLLTLFLSVGQMWVLVS